MAGYIPSGFARPKTVTHPSTNRARHGVNFVDAPNAVTATAARFTTNGVIILF